ncbi:DNA oxidative demethylase AlkB [Pectobacterium atrosepticum]|uniref:DNA oxidative demethylase AlkB n=1 Tax=Pectobacterium atrosepticum TaxID=29471 RepID=UPI00039E9A48|nr:DNA oxidative demethylase AlkB [Pectobacterium atrosepticum]GKV86085.1 alpha-ketoglutarate-dependent dioxygenase AlkB [Pectobacterium carotovorum subsp. carotovorum]AIA69802.1 alpha-ketoglutarate-dependent dioxygenase [Pectobacterium atrosepticum]AIK12713.1 alkylated DNA repair protein [Pectobacterium atrosepticum]ATY89721.1 DNA oxidative demethylase AlkB [Pectobacterium atrosepticum]KFX11878.1 alpha-ketoglutarate-dependent dioxygenase [Pectobacterium atrosepticum]
MNFDLFADEAPRRWTETLASGAVILRGRAYDDAAALLAALQTVIACAPLRNMITPGGFVMSVAMSNCGQLGWVTDEQGYRYTSHDPLSGEAWPAMPEAFSRLAKLAASEAGFVDFEPDACLINRYDVGTRMSLHQDKNERDFHQPIVSVSLGLSATFLFGGMVRSDKARRVPLTHGDVVVWGGESRLYFHGILPLKSGAVPEGMPDECRFNLTFRKAG